ncbi:MAG: glycosyltransferase [Actinomycetota bacterium]|nr:glycosyltransferase [Actinomycetota bacterium]
MSEGVSVVIPTHDRPVALARLLASIGPSEELGIAAQVVIVDDGSATGTYDVLKTRYPQFHWIRQARAGPAIARNRGWHAADGELIVFVDDDVVLDPHALAHLCHALTVDDAVGARIEPLHRGRILADFMHEEHLVSHKVQDGRVRWLVTACLAVRRSTLELVGGFDEELTGAGGEDVDLSLRMKEMGLRLGVCQGAVAYHDHRAGLASLVRTYYRHGTGQRRLAAQHQERRGDLIESTRTRLNPAAWRATYRTYRQAEDRLTSVAFVALRAGMMVPWLVGAARGSARHGR